MAGTIPPPRPLSRNTPVSQLTAGDIAYLLAWQAHLIAEAIACEKDLDRNPFNEAREVEALFPPPPKPHRWQGIELPYHNKLVARCALCHAEVEGRDQTSAMQAARDADAQGCPGARTPVGAP